MDEIQKLAKTKDMYTYKKITVRFTLNAIMVIKRERLSINAIKERTLTYNDTELLMFVF